MDYEFFVGRFHPLIVHLPIGFLLLAGLMQVLAYTSKERYRTLTPAISFTVFWGGIACIAACLMGWLLASKGGYDEETLNWHMWLGIGLTGLTFVGWLIKSKRVRVPKAIFYYTLAGMILLVTGTGHLGGNLTHGSTYLVQYAPPTVKKILGYDIEQGNALANMPATADSVVVFEHLILPVLEAKCSSCHNDTKTNGGLNVTSAEALTAGGDYGDILAAGSPLESELFRRMTLPQSSKKFMPPSGEPLTYSELKLMEWWIANGATYEKKLTEDEVPEEIHMLLVRDYDLDTHPKPFYETVEMASLPEEVLQRIEEAGFSVHTLASENNFLEINTTNLEEVTTEQLEALLAAKEHITWLDLGDQNVSDEMLMTIGQLTNLTKLSLEKNPITSQGIASLDKLTHLELLNLYDTDVTNEALEALDKFPALKKLYLWQTEVTPDAVEALQTARPDLEVNIGFQLTAQK